MQIKYHGKTCFSLKEGDSNIVVDPYENAIVEKANVMTLSEPNVAFKPQTPETKLFNWPGEYETKGVYFVGIPSFRNPKDSEKQEENTVFRIECNGMRLCHLGHLGTKLTPEQLEQIGDVDVLFVPVGGQGSIDAKKAKEVMEQIEPRVTIPMLYDEESLAAFMKEMGSVNAERLDVFTAKRSELPEEMSKVVVLKNG
jgi:L-ascorbate metabolism protein UlaG (beta-lactamase superfamily)